MKRQSLKCLDHDELIADEQRRASRPPDVVPAAGRLPLQLVVWVSEVAALLGRQAAARACRGRRSS